MAGVIAHVCLLLSFALPSPQETVANLRKYYPDDKLLMQFADFMDTAGQNDPKVTFTKENNYVLFPRSPDGSIKLF